jgi:hypothetical protein
MFRFVPSGGAVAAASFKCGICLCILEDVNSLHRKFRGSIAVADECGHVFCGECIGASAAEAMQHSAFKCPACSVVIKKYTITAAKSRSDPIVPRPSRSG